jgi:hypothetical protein
VVALVMFVAVGFARPGNAQRSMVHGSSSAHSVPAFRGAFTASAQRSFTGAPRYTENRPLNSTSGFLGSTPRNFASRPNYYYGPPRYRRPYPTRYGYGVPYLGVGWIAPVYLNSGYLDSGDSGYQDTTDDNSQGPPNTAEYDNPSPDQALPAPGPLYPSYIQPPPAPSSALPEEDAVTLIFKDRRPPEQIHNYAMTRTTLYVRDQHHRDIPLDQLDFHATQKVNHDAGIDFQLPKISR